MSQTPESPILAALYNRKRDEAERLAADGVLTIWEAAALGRDARVRELMRQEPSLANEWTPDGWTPLMLAAFFATASTVRLLLDHGAEIDVSARNAMKVQPLHAAVGARNRDSVELLLDRRADPNARQQIGYTPLMGAASAGREDLVLLLLSRGADASLVSEDGKTAESIALEHGHTSLAERLRAMRKADI